MFGLPYSSSMSYADPMDNQAKVVRHRVGAWLVEMLWPPGDSGGGPKEVRITPHPEADPVEVSRGITTGTLRAIPLAQTLTQLREEAEAEQRADSVFQRDREIHFERPVRRIRAAVEADPKPGRKGRPDAFFLAVAWAYVWLNHWHTPNPVQQLAEACGVERRLAANWVRLAREKGLLTEATEGFPGGELTLKALQMTDDEESE
jgi:hypothetical protein